MFTYKVFLFLFFSFRVVKSEMDSKTLCANDYRNMANDKIDVTEYCSRNNCVEKCCGEGELFNAAGECINSKVLFKRFVKKLSNLSKDYDYSTIDLHSWDGKNKQKSKKSFVFIVNRRALQNCTSEHNFENDFFIEEDGSLEIQDTSESKLWTHINRLEYCVDFKVVPVNGRPKVKLVMREYNADDAEDVGKKSIFVLVGLIISSFFLVLVLVVYCLLPQLRNLIGRVLMAYTLSILVTFLLKIFMYIGNGLLESKQCKIISPILYFTAMSSFFWLNIMSFDVWWSLRGHRKRCDINRRGENVKFMWYCLYAWGSPLLITAIVTTLDNINLQKLHITLKPPFSDCFFNVNSIRYYFFLPIGVIISVNIILFILTVYNIWMIKKAVQRCNDSRSSKQDANRFMTYIKLSVVMGVSWCLELVPSTTPLWVFILTTTYNLFIGVAIFFLFVFKKKIFIKLCKRFNINNRYTKSLEVSQVTRTSGTRSTKAYTKDQSHEMDLLKDCPKGTT
ncbi:hypothetical protein PYW07_004365 [Mythimna separata]|uniref:G-protein coupled receptors family 2 profile 2 domain-containing protein n=1 Tax=Mythimna separata TaxID=271217 RepID=A0AAD8DY01_MYTSE|nr:hypothetical protein PYW07_004365 [Mythimna separata]